MSRGLGTLICEGPPGVCVICTPSSSISFSSRGRRRAAILILCEAMGNGQCEICVETRPRCRKSGWCWFVGGCQRRLTPLRLPLPRRDGSRARVIRRCPDTGMPMIRIGERARTSAPAAVIKIGAPPVSSSSRCHDTLVSLCSAGLPRPVVALPRALVESVAESSLYSLIDSASACTAVSRTQASFN